MHQEQQRYRRRFNEKVPSTRDQIKIGFFVFVPRKHTEQEQTTNKLAIIAEEPYEVAFLGALTVTMNVKLKIEWLLRSRTVQSSILVSDTLAILNSVNQAPPNSRTSHKKRSLQPFATQPHTGGATPENVIHRIIDYDIAKDQSPRYRAQWYGYGSEDDTRESIPYFPRSHIMRFHHLRNLPLPPAALLNQSQVDQAWAPRHIRRNRFDTRPSS